MKSTAGVHGKRPLTKAGLKEANALLTNMTVAERIRWAVDTFGDGLYALTSAGVDSALMLHQIALAGVSIPVIHINTGFLPPETLAFRDALQKRYGFRLHEFGPTAEQIADIELLRLWEGDMGLYSKLTKLDPLSGAIKELGVTALLTGVRGDQTTNRAGLGCLSMGNDGEIRINPLIDWSKGVVDLYIQVFGLPRNPLFARGYGSVGDQHLTVPGTGRSGRTVMECGINVTGGNIETQ